ncbi:MAG: hypothetical protein FJZ38_21065 [Candidatus Rokubacteria bacterium]|nr:hypothetical protein [Candidatus Rokubacteria bacterium]
MELPVIDTTNLGLEAAVDALIVHVERLRTERAAAEQQARAARTDAGRSACAFASANTRSDRVG